MDERHEELRESRGTGGREGAGVGASGGPDIGPGLPSDVGPEAGSDTRRGAGGAGAAPAPGPGDGPDTFPDPGAVAGLGVGAGAGWGAVLAPRLAQFAAVARHEHVTRAAQELGMPQPTLSRAMARLEADLGVALFARHGRAVRLTPAGLTFRRAAERALAEVERAAEAVREDADPESGRVAFGFLHTLGAETVPALLRAFRAAHPRVRFQLVQTYGEAMLEQLRAGELDLCLTSPLPQQPGVAVRKLDEQRLRLVVPAGHPLAHRKRVRLAEAAADLFVTLEPGYGLRRITDDLCAEAGFTPRIAFEGEEAETLRGLVAAGLGVALLPPPAVPRPGVTELDVIAPRAVRHIGLAWLDTPSTTPPVTAFRDFLLTRKDRLLQR
ncbi:LysR family transcriptional regulator [Actinacidiphila acididurans]|uniref:LysR family transcriptional regulator n=1 Tax=Actinacidiphila acididurans TaxID=2784346 RepID=A0ABS2TMR3_9ACTN|nr:LysR family transcriptional regulator [Actinacidiphila acididurans]MBM9504632.1 LysR family transcriptional regulator [Actinacidiphila acididurans]